MNNKFDYSLVIEDGHNTSYITSFISALFYKSLNIDLLLDKIPHDIKFIFVQEFIKINFIESFKKGNTIYCEVINELRNYINLCGWAEKINEMISHRNIYDFYDFFIENIDPKFGLNFYRYENNKIVNINMKTINIIIPDNINYVNLSDLFKLWLKSYITLDKYKYKIDEFTPLIAIHLSRKNNIKTKVDIMTKIKFFNIDDKLQNKLLWKIQSMICKDENDNYYSIVHDNHKWLMISDKYIPSIKEISMFNQEDVYKLSTEVVFVFYNSI